jgi:hypothetical protein
LVISTLQRLSHRGLIRPPRWLPGSGQKSGLPEGPSARPALNDLLVRLRLGRSTA